MTGPFMTGPNGDGNRRTHRPSLRHRLRSRRRPRIIGPRLFWRSWVLAFLKDCLKERGPAGERRSPSPRGLVNRRGNRRLLAPQDPSCSPLGRGETRGTGVRPTSGSRFSPSQGAVRPVSENRVSPVKGKTPLVLPYEGRDTGARGLPNLRKQSLSLAGGRAPNLREQVLSLAGRDREGLVRRGP